MNSARWTFFAATLMGVFPAAAELPKGVVAGLAAEAFATREQAQAELLDWARSGGEQAVHDLFGEVRTTNDPEVRARCLRVLRDLSERAYLEEDGAEGYLGISMDPRVAPAPGEEVDGFGVIVGAVTPDTAADHAGLKPGDIIFSLNGKSWNRPDAGQQLTETVRSLKPGTEVVLEVKRSEEVLDLRAQLGRRPKSFDQRRGDDPLALERAEREAFFRGWLRENRPPR